MLFSPDFMHRLWDSHGLPFTFGTGEAFHGRLGGPGVNLTTYLYLVNKLRMIGFNFQCSIHPHGMYIRGQVYLCLRPCLPTSQ